MADETDAPTQAPAETAAPETPAAAPAPKAAGGLRRFLLLAAGIAVAAGGAGYGASLLTGWRSTPKEAAAEAPPAAEKPGVTGDEFKYKDLDAITVNLDEPRLARYVSARLTLAIPAADFEAVSPLIDEKAPVLKDWLTVYMASCSLSDVRGAANLNRIRREILDAFNRELWPDQKPRISHILFKEFAVK